MFPLPESNIKNNFELKTLIDNVEIDNSYSLASFDVESLFINVLHELILDVSKAKCGKIKDRILLSQREFLAGIRTFLKST